MLQSVQKFLPILLLLLLTPLYFYNLGGSSLIDFDEAWYAEIARNIIVRSDPFVLLFNGERYLDHPPTGFVLMAGSFTIFGLNEFAARLPSAILGFGTLIIVYLIGKRLFNAYVGLSASFILSSCS